MGDQRRVPEHVLLPYQRRWIEDASAVKVWEKSRRIGASYVEALDSVLNAAPSRGAGGQSTYYLSYNKDMTRQFIRDCAFWAKQLNIAARELDELVLGDEDKDITVYRIRFASEYEIWGMPSEPRSLRSKQGRVVIDEAAFVDDLDAVLKAALALLMWGGCVRVLSTHDGDDNRFNELIREIREGRKNYALHRTTIDEAIREGLYRRIALVRGIGWSPESEREWRQSLFAEYGAAAGEELLCIPARAGRAYFSRSLLDSVATGDCPVIRDTAPDDFMWQEQGARERVVDRWFEDEVRPILEAIEGPVYVGEDFGRSGDLTVLWVYELRSEREIRTAVVVELRNWPFSAQWQAIRLLLDGLAAFSGAAFDARGNGQQSAEYAAQEWPGYVEQVMLARAWYAAHIPPLRARMEDGEITLPADEAIAGDFRSIGLVHGIPLVLDRTGGVRAQRHGDAAIAAALGLFALTQDQGAGPAEYAYTPVRTDNPFAPGREADRWDD